MLEIPDIIPDKSNRVIFNLDEFFVDRKINVITQVSQSDNEIIRSQISEISSDIQHQEKPISNSIESLNRLLENYNENIFDDFKKYNIISLIIFNLPREEGDYLIFIQFFLNFLRIIKKANNLDLFNAFVTPDVIEFLCEFLRESIKLQSTSYFLQEKTIKALLLIFNHHESYSILLTNPKFKLLTTLIFVFKMYLKYINGSSRRVFNINKLNKSQQDLFKSSIYIIDCFSLFFMLLNEDEIRNNFINSIKVITNLLIEATFSNCIQVNNEAMAALLTCCERFPRFFYQCICQSQRKEDFILFTDPKNIYDESTNILALDIFVYITRQVENNEVNEIISQTPLMSNLIDLLKCNFEKFMFPVSLIIINFVQKSSQATILILNDNSEIIQNMLQYFSFDLRHKEKLSILYLYASSIVSLDDEAGSVFLPYFVDIGISKSIFSELVDSIVSTQCQKMILDIIKCIVRLLVFSSNARVNENLSMMNTISKLITPEQIYEIAEFSKDHKNWSFKLIEMIEKHQENQ